MFASRKSLWTADALTRRQALGLGSAGVLLLNTGHVWAQETDQYSVLTPLFDKAYGVWSFAVKTPLEEIDSNIIDFIQMDYFERRNALAAARQTTIFSDQETAVAYVNDIPAILPAGFPVTYDESTLDTQRRVIGLLAEDNFPIAPDPHVVTPADIPEIPPREEKNSDSDIVVVGDILLETLGVSIGEDSVILSFIESDGRIKEEFKKLVSKISSKEWDEVISLGEAVFKLFVGSQVWAKIRERAGRKITFRFALRCVPLVGWLYCGAAFLIAVKKNYHRFSFA